MNKFFPFSFILIFFFNACIADDYSFDELLIFANKGDKAAQYNLGLMYQLGQEVTKDEAKAVKWYIKSAEQGVAEAQYNLGVIYSRG
jgi:TPR repeat protein